MPVKAENISIYQCETCEHHFGLLYSWDEVDDETEVVCCPVCEGGAISHVQDSSIS